MRYMVTIAALILGILLGIQSRAWGQAMRLGALPSVRQETIAPRDQAPAHDPWYSQYYGQQPKDPRTLVRERAQFYAQQRQLRIASRAWFGISASRPMTTADLLYGDRANRWTSNSVIHPYRWAYQPPGVVVYIPAGATPSESESASK